MSLLACSYNGICLTKGALVTLPVYIKLLSGLDEVSERTVVRSSNFICITVSQTVRHSAK
jgi:hypothetical protein